jgi:predicted DNA-binding protein
MTAALRLNARLTPELGQKLGRVQRRTGKSVTEIVHAALERYCDEVEEAESLVGILEEVGLVGCAEGPADFSASYKDHLSSSLTAKASKAPR